MDVGTKTAPDTSAADTLFGLLPPAFRACVGHENSRFDLSLPRALGGFVYATDGRVCVRVPATPDLVAAEAAALAAAPPSRLKPPHRFPRCDEVFAPDGGFSAAPHPVPADLPSERCGECLGRKLVYPSRPCPECKGEGVAECQSCGHEGECAPCRGKGRVSDYDADLIPCPECRGGGVVYSPHDGAVVGGAKVAYRFLALVAAAGADLFPAAVSPATSGVRFAAPGGLEGVVMPMRPDRDT